MKTYTQILKEVWQEREKYFENWPGYLRSLKVDAQATLGDVQVLVFGSIVKGHWTPNSDIDVLIISNNLPENWEERRAIRTRLKSRFRPAPLQIHLVTQAEYTNWYKNFIKQDYVKI